MHSGLAFLVAEPCLPSSLLLRMAEDGFEGRAGISEVLRGEAIDGWHDISRRRGVLSRSILQVLSRQMRWSQIAVRLDILMGRREEMEPPKAVKDEAKSMMWPDLEFWSKS